MARLIYPIKPLQHAISTESPALFTQPGFAPWVSNGRIEQGSFKKRWGYSIDRTIGTKLYEILIYQTLAGTRSTLYLTTSDLCKKETGTGKTFSYATQTYTTGTVTNVSAANPAVITGSGTTWNTSGLAAGDKFILSADLTADVEPDTNWGTIATVAATEIILTGAYTGTTGAFNPAKTYNTRMVYSVPSNERWSWAIVNDRFCFTNGNVDVQSWAGANYAVALDSTNAKQARYCREFANRLFLADFYISTTRYPLSIKWSKEADPATWVDSTAGELDLIETDDYISGLGKSGGNLVIFKKEGLLLYGRTGDATNPIRMVSDRRGVGCVAPYSIVDVMGTCAFLGRDDFYILNGDQVQSIGEPIRNKFMDIVGYTEIENVWGVNNPNLNELMWVASTDEGQIVFTFNYKYKEWSTYSLADSVNAFGRGAL